MPPGAYEAGDFAGRCGAAVVAAAERWIRTVLGSGCPPGRTFGPAGGAGLLPGGPLQDEALEVLMAEAREADTAAAAVEAEAALEVGAGWTRWSESANANGATLDHAFARPNAEW